MKTYPDRRPLHRRKKISRSKKHAGIEAAAIIYFEGVSSLDSDSDLVMETDTESRNRIIEGMVNLSDEAGAILKTILECPSEIVSLIYKDKGGIRSDAPSRLKRFFAPILGHGKAIIAVEEIHDMIKSL